MKELKEFTDLLKRMLEEGKIENLEIEMHGLDESPYIHINELIIKINTK